MKTSRKQTDGPVHYPFCNHTPLRGQKYLPHLLLIFYLFITIFIVGRRIGIDRSYCARRHSLNDWRLGRLALVELWRYALCRVLCLRLLWIVGIEMCLRWWSLCLIIGICWRVGLSRRWRALPIRKVVSAAWVVEAGRASACSRTLQSA